MNNEEIMKLVDLTNLKQTATKEDIMDLMDKAARNECASICIMPAMIPFAKEYRDDIAHYDIKLCTVIGFPNGYNSTAVKVFETKDAIANGADEVDIVVNINDVIANDWNAVKKEFKEISDAITELTKVKPVISKMIMETCFLNEMQIRQLCHIAAETQIDFVKTSTGFAKMPNNQPTGATKEVVSIMADEVNIINDKFFAKYNRKTPLRIKASGGIRTFEFADELIALGVSRIGASSLN